MQIKKIVALPSRTGRHLQRYNQGFRQVVGCIPYRIRDTKKSHLIDDITLDDLEILLISSQKSTRLMFPKGGWELDEDIELAASRETLEEAGVVGQLGKKLGEWIFKSKSQEKYHEGSMFPLYVTEVLDVWPEKSVRQRVWVSVNEAREACAAVWMKEALEEFVYQFTCTSTEVEEDPLSSCLSAVGLLLN
ncbi:nudix hydrolase-like protein 17 [Perilla frutescens var. frutescens]|nr:nudix hydrolase-like protein 17 [Perilla frutescens var. frutescens]